MSNWYILPNGNIKHVNGLEIQPEHDWFPTEASMLDFVESERAAGISEVQIAQRMMALAIECEEWARNNLA